MQAGRAAARNALRALARQPTAPFRYRDPGCMATIGRARAVADLGWIRLTGYPAWLAWLFLHLVFLIGFKNRVVVLVQWLVAYVTRQRGVRLITGADRRRRHEPGQLPLEAEHPAGQHLAELAAGADDPAVDDDRLQPFRQLVRLLVGGGLLDRAEIEDERDRRRRPAAPRRGP